eukprot:SAG11_NODE_11943_length_730_cov_1.237718_2_plen_119_part_01
MVCELCGEHPVLSGAVAREQLEDRSTPGRTTHVVIIAPVKCACWAAVRDGSRKKIKVATARRHSVVDAVRKSGPARIANTFRACADSIQAAVLIGRARYFLLILGRCNAVAGTGQANKH